jgi:hypothetical protein
MTHEEFRSRRKSAFSQPRLTIRAIGALVEMSGVIVRPISEAVMDGTGDDAENRARRTGAGRARAPHGRIVDFTRR